MRPLHSLARFFGLMDSGRGSVALSDLFHGHPSLQAPPERARLLREPLSEGPRARHVILVHGNYWKDALKPLDDPEERLFLLEPLRSDPRYADLCRDRSVFVFLYPTHQDVRESGRALAELAREQLGPPRGRDLTVVAHSLGGLVARWALPHHGLGDRLADLITLATPHHGTILASILWTNAAIRRKVGLIGLICQRLSRRIWPANDGLASMQYDNLDGLLTDRDIDHLDFPVNDALAALNRSDPFLERTTCVMGRIRTRWLKNRNLFDQIPRWLVSRIHPMFRGLDPLVHLESGLAEGLAVRARHVLDDLDHEGIVTSQTSRDLVYRLMATPAA